jgi:hypothetical protein
MAESRVTSVLAEVLSTGEQTQARVSSVVAKPLLLELLQNGSEGSRAGNGDDARGPLGAPPAIVESHNVR